MQSAGTCTCPCSTAAPTERTGSDAPSQRSDGYEGPWPPRQGAGGGTPCSCRHGAHGTRCAAGEERTGPDAPGAARWSVGVSAPDVRPPGGNRAGAEHNAEITDKVILASGMAKAGARARAPRDSLTPGQRARLVGHPRQLELELPEGGAL